MCERKRLVNEMVDLERPVRMTKEGARRMNEALKELHRRTAERIAYLKEKGMLDAEDEM